jgi:hypothetical protein
VRFPAKLGTAQRRAQPDTRGRHRIRSEAHRAPRSVDLVQKGPLNLQAFDTHGLSLAETSPRHFSLYTTSHGERESIEIYDLDLRGAAPLLTWKGCVLLQQDGYHNSVARR